MFAVIYVFKVKEEHEEEFVQLWKQVTEGIREYEGGLGSRLHKNGNLVYVAYAQWPDKELWSNSGSRLPQETVDARSKMKRCCESIETTHELDVLEDLLVRD